MSSERWAWEASPGRGVDVRGAGFVPEVSMVSPPDQVESVRPRPSPTTVPVPEPRPLPQRYEHSLAAELRATATPTSSGRRPRSDASLPVLVLREQASGRGPVRAVVSQGTQAATGPPPSRSLPEQAAERGSSRELAVAQRPQPTLDPLARVNRLSRLDRPTPPTVGPPVGAGTSAHGLTARVGPLRPCGEWGCLLEEAEGGAVEEAGSWECELCGDWVRERGRMGCWRCRHAACVLCWLRVAAAASTALQEPACPYCRDRMPRARLAQLGSLHNRHRGQLPFRLQVLQQNLRATPDRPWVAHLPDNVSPSSPSNTNSTFGRGPVAMALVVGRTGAGGAAWTTLGVQAEGSDTRSSSSHYPASSHSARAPATPPTSPAPASRSASAPPSATDPPPDRLPRPVLSTHLGPSDSHTILLPHERPSSS